MKYSVIGATAIMFAMTSATFADESGSKVTVEPTVNTICFDTRLTHDGAKACKEEMAEADTSQEKQEVFQRFAARIDGQTPLRNSLTSSGAGVKDASPAPRN